MRFIVFILTTSSLFAQSQIFKNPLAGRRPAAGGKAPEYNKDFYEGLRNFAEGLYKQKERPDFRMRVDRQYEELLRSHADRAFQVNTSPKSEIKIILEDRFRFFSGLYDNLMIQDVTNRIGQEVTPKWSEKYFTFKLIADPVPRAETLATGTIYVTTGLVASLDNKAQLAYVLAHEAAHVAKDHWKTRIMIDQAKEEYASMKEENLQQMRTFGTLVGLGVGIAAGGIANAAGAGGGVSTLIGAGAMVATKYAIAGAEGVGRLNIDWNVFEEDEADDIAMKAMLDAKLNAKEVPALYLVMDKLSMKDDRVGMGFWGNRTRMQERMQKVREFLTANVKTDDKLTGSDPEYRKLMAELKRDNGILAYHYDMLEVARNNLEQAADVKNSDPVALYYYAKILTATAKTEEDRTHAIEAYSQVLAHDSTNHAYGAYLHRATALIDKGGEADKRQAAELLEAYVAHYIEAMDELRDSNSSRMPPHMDTIIDYMRRAGVEDWKYGKKRAQAVVPESEKPQIIPASTPDAPRTPTQRRRPASPQTAPK